MKVTTEPTIKVELRATFELGELVVPGTQGWGVDAKEVDFSVIHLRGTAIVQPDGSWTSNLDSERNRSYAERVTGHRRTKKGWHVDRHDTGLRIDDPSLVKVVGELRAMLGAAVEQLIKEVRA